MYELLSNQFSLKLFGRDLTRTIGELLVRWYHLKFMRWGRDTVQDTEQETTQSRQLATLASILCGKLFLLPPVPLIQQLQTNCKGNQFVFWK